MNKDEAVKNYIAELDKRHEANMVKLKAESLERDYQARKKAYPDLTEEQLKSPSFHADRLESMIATANKILRISKP